MLNKVQLIGNLGADPEMKYLADGTPVCKVRLATNEKWTDANGEKKERTEWHSITFWRKLAEICGQYLTKGRQIYVEGILRNDTWETDGVKRYGYHIEGRTMQMLGSNGSERQPEAPVDEQEPPPF